MGAFIDEKHWIIIKDQHKALASETRIQKYQPCFLFHYLISVKHSSLTSTANLFDLIARLCIFVTKQPF